MNNPNPRPYSANFKRFGKQIYLGCFATAEEAALHVARTPEKREAASLPPPMTAAEAMAEAEAEGLTLARADNQSGFRSVHVHNCHSYTLTKPYEARVPPYGYFATAEEAALQIARTTEARGHCIDADGVLSREEFVELAMAATAKAATAKAAAAKAAAAKAAARGKAKPEAREARSAVEARSAGGGGEAGGGGGGEEGQGSSGQDSRTQGRSCSQGEPHGPIMAAAGEGGGQARG